MDTHTCTQRQSKALLHAHKQCQPLHKAWGYGGDPTQVMPSPPPTRSSAQQGRGAVSVITARSGHPEAGEVPSSGGTRRRMRVSGPQPDPRTSQDKRQSPSVWSLGAGPGLLGLLGDYCSPSSSCGMCQEPAQTTPGWALPRPSLAPLHGATMHRAHQSKLIRLPSAHSVNCQSF